MFRLVSFLLLMTTLVCSKDELMIVPQSLLNQVEKGHAESAYFIATQFDNKSYMDEKFYPKAKEWMQKAAEMGYPQAMFELAQMFGSEELEVKALEWFLKASEFGHSEAIYNIANFHLRGLAEKSADCLKAYEWYEKAEAKENIVSFNDHAWSLATSSQGQCRNPEKALRIFSSVKSYYQTSVEMMPSAYIDTQAAVHASVSDFNIAIELQQEAIGQISKDHPYRNDYIKRLESYKNRKAWLQKDK